MVRVKKTSRFGLKYQFFLAMITDGNVCTAPQRLSGLTPQNMVGNVRTCPLNIQWCDSKSSRQFGGLVETLDP